MRLKKLGAALVVVAALGAVLASSAFAEGAMQVPKQWYVGTPGKLLSGSKTVNVKSAGGTFTTEVGKTKYKLHSTGVSCVGCIIENSGGHAIGSGKLKFEGVTVEEPAGCSVASTIETASLSVTADWMESVLVENPETHELETVTTSTNYVKFVPTAGEATEFATVKITGCALATTLVPKGSVFARTVNATGVLAAEQPVESSEAINATAGGNLHVGTKNASLTANATFTLASGEAFGTE
jgi:hypothetical protein